VSGDFDQQRRTAGGTLLNLTWSPTFLREAFILSPKVKVSDWSQPPMRLDLSLSETAGSRSLDRWLRAFVAS
jgi:hypothetical protein